MDTTNTPTINNQQDKLKNMQVGDDPQLVRKRAVKLIEESKDGDFKSNENTDVFKGMTLYEFDNGTLLSLCATDTTRTFAIDFMRNLKIEHNCVTPSEKATAELATVNYIRTLQIQQKIANLFSNNGMNRLDVVYLSVLSKELDRANRHYFTSIQTLRSLKQPVLQVNIRADTAVVGQNQMVQTNNESK